MCSRTEPLLHSPAEETDSAGSKPSRGPARTHRAETMTDKAVKAKPNWPTEVDEFSNKRRQPVKERLEWNGERGQDLKIRVLFRFCLSLTTSAKTTPSSNSSNRPPMSKRTQKAATEPKTKATRDTSEEPQGTTNQTPLCQKAADLGDANTS
ncbi:hypothetical protein WMY93_008786 [Mugilogobius chulae]|uniref:Uncharacterized protein n=1 Tax=Mugilogobius chulae TaxID=88201 RepID=A0AAW0PN82_9GOBI